MRSALVRAVVLALAWWALAGGEGIVFGAAAVVGATASSIALLPPSGRRLSPSGVARFLRHFTRESLVGGIDVALRALAPRPDERTSGTYIPYRTSLEPGIPRSLLVGLVGLLPGTVAVEAHGAEIRIHLLDRGLADPARIEELERRIAAMISPGGRR